MWPTSTTSDARPLALRGQLARVTALAVVLCSGSARGAGAGINVWTRGGPVGDGVRVIATDPASPHTLYVGTDSGVRKSTDGGMSWQDSSSGLPAKPVGVLAIDPLTPGTLYASTQIDGISPPDGVFKSIDGGSSWIAVNTGLTNLNVVALAIDPYRAGTLYATVSCLCESFSGPAVFKSTDGATSWQASSRGLPVKPVNSLLFDPFAPNTLYAVSLEGIFKSVDGGSSWIRRSTFAGFRGFAIDPFTPDTLYAVPTPGLLKSTDGGSTWSDISPPTNYTVVAAIAVDPTIRGTLYAAVVYSTQDVFKSTDGGVSWMHTSLDSNASVSALTIDPHPPSTLYAGTSDGVFAIQYATFTVTSTDDGPDALLGDGVCATAAGQCTLRAAVDEANSLPNGSTIEVPAGTYLLTRGVLGISVDLVLNGAGAASTRIDGGGSSRVLDVTGGTVVVSQMTIQNGRSSGDCGGVMNRGDLTLTNVTISDNSAHIVGGGICNDGQLTFTNSTVRDNALLNDCCPAFGGGISNHGEATLTNVVITGNMARGPHSGGGTGGGIQNWPDATLVITGGTVSGNACDGSGNSGGGIHNDGDATVSQATISANTADSGAGIENTGRLTLTNSTVSGNMATEIGGGIDSKGTLTISESTVNGNAARKGGGIYSLPRQTLTNVTISGNAASGQGGGIFNAGDATLTNVTVTANTAAADAGIFHLSYGGLMQAKNTIVANNPGGDCSRAIVSLGTNLSSDATCGFALSNTDPKLGPLRDNGGPTFTQALQAGSPAIDAGGPDCPPPTTDQRGVRRSPPCDIGAYEFAPTTCAGDCDAYGTVSIDELLILVNIVLGNAEASVCPHGVASGAAVDIAMIIQAVNNALSGCGSGQ